MNKMSKQKLFIITALFLLLLLSSTLSLLPSANAATVSTQEKTDSILNNVLNINTTAYSAKLNSQADKYGPLEKSLTDITLSANNTSVRVSASFVNDSLHLLLLSEYTGAFAKTKPASASVDMAKDFLVKYHAYTGDSFYSTLASTLNNPTVVNNATKTTDNVMLKVSNYDQKIVDYIWTYVDENGVVAAIKNICLSYDQGRLSSFLNNWPLYKIADTKASISQEQAVKIALAAAENYTYQVNINNATSTISVAGFQFNPKSLSMAALSYVNSPDKSLARDSDPYTLYPCWYIPLGFNKAYPADLTGISVRIWADTGEVVGMSPMTFGGAYEASARYQSSESSFAVCAPITFGLVLCMLALFINRKRVSRLIGKRLGNPKFWSLLFCLSILSGLTLSTVNAEPMTSSRIYASNVYQMSQEIDAMANNVTYYMTTYFNGNEEFDVFNRIGTGTVKASIQNDATYDSENYDSAIVFYFGHMYNPALLNPGLKDNAAQAIMADDISDYTEAGKHRFVFMWACRQVDDYASSDMVQAWLPGITSGNGIVAPDNSGKCFIGFNGTSPPISDWTPMSTFGNDVFSYPMQYFIIWFYYDTIVECHSVAYALNHASQEILGYPFTSSALNTGYITYWPFPDEHQGYHPGRMIVCGNANIHLWQYIRTLSISSSAGGYATPTGTQEYLERTIATVQAYNYSGYHFTGWLYDGSPASTDTQIQIFMAENHTLQATFTPDGTTYTTAINVYYTWGGSPYYITYQYSQNIELPYGSNYLDFTNGPMGGYFMQAYNYADSSMHYSSADTYWTGSGTSIDVLWTW